MSLFGKLLAIFNVLAAIAFFSVAILDWSKRQSWQTAVFRQELVLTGLPLDDDERDPDGKPLVRLLSEDTLKDVYGTAGGKPEKTQMDEVKRVQTSVLGFVTAAPNPEEDAALRAEIQKNLTDQAQRLGVQIGEIDREIALENQGKKRQDVLAALDKQKKDLQAKQDKVNENLKDINAVPVNQTFQARRLASVLLPFATSSVEYENLAQRTTSSEDPTPQDLADLQTRFANLFSATQSGKASPEERKFAVARLLVNFIGVDSTVTLPRVLAESGLDNTIRALEAQTQVMRKLTDDLAYTIERDRSEFVVEQSRALNQVRDLADELRTQKRFLAAQQDLVSRQTELVKGLEKEIDQALPPGPNQPLPLGLKQRLAAAQDAVKVDLDIQEKMEASLFNARKQLRDLGELNRKLELQLHELEEKAKSR